MLLTQAYDADDPVEGERLAREAHDIACRSRDADLELCALSEIGAWLVELGRVEEGFDLIDEAMAASLGGEGGSLRQLPGLTRFVQNYIVASPAGHICDGVGELWFENDDAMETALNSPEMGAAVESAKNFLDMEKTGIVIVEEKALIG